MKRHALIFLIITLVILSACKSKKDIKLTPTDIGTDREMYEKAKKYIKRDSDKARLLFKEIMQLHPNSIYANKAKIGIADSYFKAKDAASLIMASAEYQEFVNMYPNSPDAVYALYQVGMCYYKQMKKPGRDQTNTHATIKAFENLLQQYPDTQEAEDARKKIHQARQNLATHYFRIGYYNFKFKAYIGAIARFKDVINDYPDFEHNDKLYFFTGKCYLKMKENDNALSFFQKVINSYPNSKYTKKSLKIIKKIGKMKQQKLDKK
jgi:outer membrane protein assembly factor BamD